MPASVETPDRTARNPDRPDHGGGVFSVLGVELTALLAALLLVLIAVRAFPSQQTAASLAAYLPLQSVLQMLAIVVSILVFAVGWVAYSRERVGNGVLLSCAFLAVGLIDFAFTMSYPGMPDFVTPSSEGKAIDFWLAARALAACALLFAAVRPWRPFASPRTRYWLLAAALGITALVYWLVLHLEDALPATFIPGQGPTAFKTGAEYTLIAVDVLAAGVFFARLRIERADYLRRLFTACCVIVLSELFFTFYGDVADINNLPGHLYNAIAYLLIYQALSVRGAEEPYQRLQRSRQPRRANMERRRTGLVSDWRRVGLSHDWYREQDGAAAQAMLAAIVENSSTAIIGCALDGTIVSWNAAAERMFGWSAIDAIDQPIAIITPQQHHGLLQPLFDQAARGEPVGEIESRHLRRDGACIDTAGTLVAIRDANGEPVFFTLTLWDITQQKELERAMQQKAALTELLEALARVANEATTSESTLQNCLERICDYGLWMLGRIGTFSPGQPKRVPQSCVWNCPQPARFDEFIRISNSLDHFLPSGKFTAIALREKKAVWASDFLAVSESRRLASAAKSGIRCGFVFPVVVNGEALAFLEFFAAEARDPDAALLEAINSVAGQLARVIERERARSALHESEHQLRLVTEHLPAMIAHYDAELVCRFANSAYCKFHHVDPRAVTGMSLRDIAGEDTYRAIGPMLERVKQGELVTLRRPEPAESGEIRHIEIHHVPDMSSEGAFLGYYAMVLDITERVRAETARAQLAAIVENSNDAIISRTIDGTITSWNAGAERMLGYTAAEAIGKPATFNLPPGQQPNIARNNEKVLRGETVAPHESNRMTKDGRVIDVMTSHSPIKDGAGNIVGASLILQDISALKRAEAEARQGEEWFQALFEQAGVGMALRGVYPRNPRWLRVNHKLCDILGYTREELLQLSSVDVTPPEERQTAIDYNEKLLRGELTSYSREKRYMRKDGQIIWANINLTAVNGPDGRPTHIISVVQDITARLEAEKHFRLSAAVFETTQEGIMVTDVSNRIILVNPAFTRITGRTPDEVIGKSPIILNSRMQDEAFYKTMWTSINDNERWQGEIWNRRKNGEIYCEWRSISTVKNAQGETLYHAAIFSDITKHKQAEESRARLAAIVEHSNDAIIGRAYDDTITSWNAAAERILGYTAAEVIGRDPVEIVPLESRPEIARFRKLIKASHAVTNYETVRVNKDGRHIDVAVTFAATKDNSGRVVGTSSIVRDITERKRAEQILRDYAARLQTVSRKLLEVQEDERRRIARELHDQVGQVLTALKINLQVIGRQLAAAPVALKIEECAQIADAAIQQVRTLMLDLRPPQLDELGLAAALLTHAERMVTPANLALHFSAPAVLPNTPPAIEIVCFRITQEALTNILRHAGARNVWIELAAAGDGLKLTVRDDGKGFDLPEAHRRAIVGGSIGLLSMEERAALADGRIEISTAPGAGTTVHAMFPRSSLANSKGNTGRL